MSDRALQAGTWLYFQCVDFVVHLAGLLHVTYRDANALLFFVLWPAVTVALAGWVVCNAVALRRQRSSARRRSSSPGPSS